MAASTGASNCHVMTIQIDTYYHHYHHHYRNDNEYSSTTTTATTTVKKNVLPTLIHNLLFTSLKEIFEMNLDTKDGTHQLFHDTLTSYGIIDVRLMKGTDDIVVGIVDNQTGTDDDDNNKNNNHYNVNPMIESNAINENDVGRNININNGTINKEKSSKSMILWIVLSVVVIVVTMMILGIAAVTGKMKNIRLNGGKFPFYRNHHHHRFENEEYPKLKMEKNQLDADEQKNGKKDARTGKAADDNNDVIITAIEKSEMDSKV